MQFLWYDLGVTFDLDSARMFPTATLYRRISHVTNLYGLLQQFFVCIFF